MTGPRLKRVAVAELNIERRVAGRGFAYFDSDGRPITEAETLARIRKMAIPPAYADVRIAIDDRAHLQAIGRDAAGRLQYRYHPDWVKVREKRKISHISDLIAALPKIRAAVKRDIFSRELNWAKAAACAVAMVDASSIRVGCEDYARKDGGRGAATLLKRHVSIDRERVRLQFKGKGGRIVEREIFSLPLVRALRRIMTLKGSRLLQFRAEDGAQHRLTAADVNAYLQQVSGVAISAKDFRMVSASALAAEKLAASPPASSESGRRRQVTAVMRLVAEQLVNTPAVARRSYVHAIVEESFVAGELPQNFKRARAGPFRSRAESMLGDLASNA